MPRTCAANHKSIQTQKNHSANNSAIPQKKFFSLQPKPPLATSNGKFNFLYSPFKAKKL
jgi:hypothetical protein